MKALNLLYHQGSIVTQAGSKKIALKFLIEKNLKTCTAVLLYVGSIRAKAKKPNANNGLYTCQNKAVNLLKMSYANFVG
jgi:hypothetical protein